MSSCDSDKVGRLYRDEGARLERQIARRIGNRSIARDLVHDVFLRFWERAGELRGNPAAFVTRSARNVAIDHLRREKVRCTHAAGAEAPLPAQDPAFDALSAQQSGDAVRRAIADLPETTRRLFLMNRAQGLSFQEIAAICGMSERNVAKHMAKAVARCAQALEDLRNE
ncbi:RNA polymerase sigma factor (plasmid) [Paracoccus versutus]|uniref:RNA polymerase sigma-70 factor (ECF subfamily) n=1 Tax=Paracoccus versutus TaxID=34007 RepID=A0A099FIG9_PARVE|nr:MULTISPECIES: RNA polymerase sigma factor [Paracoccus]WGR62488.1 RNA polymerase sigma factor [Paracoccus ferrooxidans]SFY07985.1 RNA polymerase sigma-70 factor, ECF subfamily [Paracoccus pantotrophus]KGJ10414.1 RNA polymerase sigma 70 [Paracoccus versutus]MBT0781720.1 RNA polymerase sigma factor [Paracoccus sp. pheM1]RDD69129.1 RNA polymerase sigma factor [Paracoccus versutus]